MMLICSFAHGYSARFKLGDTFREYVEDAVRQLLSVRGVRLQHTPGNAPSPGFSLLGVAERVPEFGEISGNPVNVWHIQSNLLPVSMAEFERWVVDAPRGRHWILSERRLPAEYILYYRPA